jgi:hypothetical protein
MSLEIKEYIGENNIKEALQPPEEEAPKKKENPVKKKKKVKEATKND